MKKIFHAKQILFYMVFILNFYLIYTNVNLNPNTNFNENQNIENLDENFDITFFFKKIFFYFFTFTYWIIISLILLLKIRSNENMYITRHEELEKFILSKNPELSNNQCPECKITRCMRSQHCNLCNHCVAKFELHSDWFHICIGSLNYLPYILILIFLNFYYISAFVNITFQVFILGRNHKFYDFKGKELAFHFWIILVFYISIKLFSYTYDLIKMSVIKNLTDHEGYNWRRLPYLWRSMRKDYFNPFDKGVKGNVKEMWIGFVNPEIKLVDRINLKVNSNQNLNETIGGDLDSSVLILDHCEKNENFENFEKNTKNSENSEKYTENFENFEKNTKNFQNCEKYTENKNEKNFDKNFEPFITKDCNVVYRQYSGTIDDFINWNRVRFYTIFDLKNSPFREVVIKQMQISGA
jgi:hypothetical protein